LLGTGTQHAPDFGNLGFQPCFLGFEALEGGGEDFGIQVQSWHVGRVTWVGFDFRC
jgi:hypothetical protein